MESTKKVIYQGDSIISIEVLPDYPHPVVVKKPSQRRSSRPYIRSLENEYEMTRSLSAVEGVRKVLAQRSIEHQPNLILEYVDGETLQDYVARNELDLRSRLEIAIRLATILERIHQQNVIHLDLNSNNTLIGHERQAVHLIDFGAASRIDHGHQLRVRPDQMLGTLSYISPEQTGRINRTVDERSDLYSLGVVLYELMTGRLPFDSKDPMELIHQHIARIPASPSEVSSQVPGVISSIILKLLSKDAEDRYQSAAGVEVDLQECLRRLRPDNSIEGFALGKADTPSRFKYPEKLYGREAELKELRSALDGACRETSSIILVAGYSGIGKTALVEEMQGPVSAKPGYFIRGKYDQYLRTTPYTGITEAFSDLVSRILAEPERNFAEWQDSIKSAVGDLGEVITEVIPALERLIGAQPNVPTLAGHEAENRFNYVFINFLSAVATEQHPLLLFLDDLQWIDAGSLRLLKVIHSEFTQPGLMLIGAYRDNEVDASHPLMELIGSLGENGVQPRILKLENLQQQHVEMFLSDTLRSQKGVAELSRAMGDKTQGNPFFLRRLLSSLAEEGLVRHLSDAGIWKWDIGEIRGAAIADNVADLLAQTIAQQVPAEARDMLQLAACIGSRFDVRTLAMTSGRSEREVLNLLTGPLGGQYVLESGGAYEFAHDQVRQAAYLLIDERGRTCRHLEIGRLLLANTDEAELEERIFDIVGHYNLGADLLTDPTERIRLARLNLQAGRKSKVSSAYSAAAAYLIQSASLLGEDKWRDNYRLTLEVHNELIEACYLNVQNEEVRVLFGTITDHAKQDVDSGVAYKTMIMSHVAENRPSEAISLAEGYLERLNISFDAALVSNLSPDELYNLPPIEDKEKRVALGILMTISTPIIFAAPERLPSLFYTVLNIIGQYGNSVDSSFAVAWYAMLLCLEERYQEGNAYGQLAVDLLNKFPSHGMSTKIVNMQSAWIRHWESSVHDLIAPLKEHHQVGLRAGEVEWSLYCLGNYTLLLWGAGKPLRTYLEEAEPCVMLCESKNQEITFLICSIFAQAAANLMGESAQTTRLEGKWFSEESMLPKMEGNPQLLAFYRSVKITLCYLFGEHLEAYQHSGEALKIRHGLNPHYLYTKISFYGGLSCIAGLADAESDADDQDRLRKLEQFEKELELWAEVAPMNYGHQYHLLQAEKSRVANDHWQAVQSYEKAIKGAQVNRFVHDEALAVELFARFWQECGNDRIAETYMREARALYHRWGASAKVSHLEDSYPQWFKTPTTEKGPPDASGTDHITISRSITPIQVDLDGVISASQALSSETDLERLLAEMMELVMSNSGAAKAVLLLRLDGDWFVQACGDVEAGEHEILLNRPFDPADSEAELVPEPVFDYCRRSEKLLVLGDARLDPRFAEDRMIQTHSIKSVLCLPVLSQGKLKAMVYLENRKAADVFNQQHVEVLRHLASQFAVSVENALLYGSLKQKVGELQESDERYELAVAGSTAGLWDWDILSNELFTSDRLKELVGFAPDEVFTLDEFWSLLHPEEYPAVRLAVEKHLEERAPYDLEYRLRAKSGEYRWFRVRGQALWDESGRATRMSGSLVDISERKLAEERLAASEALFRGVLESTPDIVVTRDVNFRLTYFNQAFADIVQKLWGVTAHVGMNTLDFHPPELQSYWQKIIARVLEGHMHTERFEWKYSEEETRHYELTMMPIQEEGRITGIAEFNRDVTERTRTEQAVKESRDRLVKAEQVGRMGFLEWNLKTNEMVWSREVYELYGIEPGTPVTLEGTVGLVHPDDLEFVNKSLDLAIRGVLSYNIDHRMVRPDGKVICVHALADLERDSEGSPTVLHGTVVDITERKLAEEGLKESEERFRNLMEQSPLAIVIYSPEGQITEVNTGWMRLWGLDGEQTAQVLASYNVRTDKQLEDLGWAPQVERAFAGECVVLPPIEYSGNRAVDEMGLEGIEAASRWIQNHLYSVKDANGDVAYVVNTVADITDLKRAEREAREQRDALARVDRATRMGQLTGSIAHELNQPLTGILSNAQAAELMIESGNWDGDELAKIMAEIAADAKRTGDVIRNLRELYREQKGEFVPVDVNDVVDETTQLLHSEFVMQDVEVTTDCAPSIPPVNGNRIQIEQVLVNLLVNGIEAVSDEVRDDRRLRVVTAYVASEVKAWVEDSGPGIDADKIDRIFEPLTTWKPGGTGMGLAISNSIIEAHGGRMWAESRPEGGARVGFALPVLKPDRQS